MSASVGALIHKSMIVSASIKHQESLVLKMKAYIFDDQPGDQRLPHDSGKSVTWERLESLGCLPRPNIDMEQVDDLALKRNYKCRDEINVSKAGLGEAYETKLRSFFEEHLHEDEEIRYILDGSGYFDLRGGSDPLALQSHLTLLNQTRTLKSGSESLSSPKISSSFRLASIIGLHSYGTKAAKTKYGISRSLMSQDESNYIKAIRLFQEAPKWTPLNRGPESDSVQARKDFLAAVNSNPLPLKA